MIIEKRLKLLFDAVAAVVRASDIDENHVGPSESPDAVAEQAIIEITYNVADFDNWYFEQDEIETDERRARFDKLPEGAAIDMRGSSPTSELGKIVKDVVEYNLQGMRDVGELPVEPNVDVLVSQLVNYIVNWEKWYYEHKQQRDRDFWFEQAGDHDEIYFDSDYADEDKSQGVSNIFLDEDNYPPGSKVFTDFKT